MSGLDVAGLALGALPLAILAVKQGIEIKHTIKDWKKIERTYSHVKNRLTYSNLFLRLQLRKLILPMLLDSQITNDNLDSLIEQPRNVRWRQGDLDIALKTRLSDPYDEYFKLLEDLAEIMAELWDKLGMGKPEFQQIITQRLNESTKAKPVTRLMSRANLRFQIQRTRLVISKRSTTELLDGVQNNLDRLEQLLRTVDEITELSGKLNGDLKLSETLLSFSEHADRVHGLMTRALQCDDSCSHIAHVWLQQKAVGPFNLKLRLLSEKETSETACPTSTQACQDISITNGITDTQYVRNTSFESSAHPDLCAAVFKSRTRGAGTLRIADEDGDVTYSIRGASDHPTNHCSMSLSQMLSPISKMTPSRLDRYEVALMLAVAKLRFYRTPWLRTGISSNDVHIPHDSGKPKIDAPFIEAILSKRGVKLGIHINEDAPFEDLAVTLLELCYGKRLEDHEGWSDIRSIGNPNVKRRAISGFIHELAAAAVKETGRVYQGAIQWCLSAEHIQGVEWKDTFAQKVVAPLKDCCGWMDAGRAKAIAVF